MRLRPTIALAGVVLVVAMAVFQLKFVVRERERELAAIRRAIQEEQWRIRTLHADWAWLTRPERLVAQASQLGLEPIRSDLLVRVADLPDATALAFAGRTLAVELDPGRLVELRFKPVSALPTGTGRRR